MSRLGKSFRRRWRRTADATREMLANLNPDAHIRRIEEQQRTRFRAADRKEELRQKSAQSDRRPDRELLIATVASLWDKRGPILDYGAGAGAVGRRMHEATGARLWLIEPTDAADLIDVPDATVRKWDDEQFVAGELPRFNVGYVRGVMVVMSPERARAVLKRMTQICDTIVLSEHMGRVHAERPGIVKNDYIMHTYGKWFAECGWAIEGIEGDPDYLLQVLRARPASS